MSTIRARSTDKVIATAAALGVARDALLREAGFSASELEGAATRVCFARYAGLLETAARLSGADDFGLRVGAAVHGHSFGVMGYAALASPTLGEALRRVADFHALWNAAAKVGLVVSGETATIGYDVSGHAPAAVRQDVEASLLSFVAPIRKAFNLDMRPTEVRFRHAGPPDTTPHRQHFGAEARLRFSAADNAVCFDAGLLDAPAPGYEPGLLALFDARAKEELDRLSGGPMTRRLREVLPEALAAGHGDIDHVARRMETSARTLQRRLEEEGRDYTALREELRLELARSWLGQPELTLDEIALMLGYSDATAFGRAFRRWTGSPPGEWRAQATRSRAS